MVLPLSLLVLSNVFMTFAWYGHLKNLMGAVFFIFRDRVVA